MSSLTRFYFIASRWELVGFAAPPEDSACIWIAFQMPLQMLVFYSARRSGGDVVLPTLDIVHFAVVFCQLHTLVLCIQLSLVERFYLYTKLSFLLMAVCFPKRERPVFPKLGALPNVISFTWNVCTTADHILTSLSFIQT